MNTGEKIKHLRTERNLTQPQLAELIGIEQSYLSKLENDKSVPSADIFQSILRAFAVDVGTFLQGVDERIVHGDLRQIPEVNNHINARMACRVHDIRKWLFGSAAACAAGLSLVVAGSLGLLFSNKQYTYSSPGVVLPGEPTDIFSNYGDLLHFKQSAGEITEEERIKLRGEFETTRVREDYLLSDDYRGAEFRIPVQGGSRGYQLKDIAEDQRAVNRYLTLLGSLLAFGGLFGFFVEYRLRKIIPG